MSVLKGSLLLLLSAATLSSALEVYLTPRYTVWEEFDADGSRLLRGLSGGVGWVLGDRILFKPSVLYTLEAWVRDLKSTPTAVGYREFWSYHTLDLKGVVSHSRGDLEGYMFGTLRLMLGDAVMRTNLEGVPTIYPRRGPAFSAGCGMRRGRFRVEVAHSYVKFNRSDPVPTSSPGVFALQPESVRRILSLTLALSF